MQQFVEHSTERLADNRVVRYFKFMKIASKIRLLVAESGLKQNEVARRAGIGTSLFSRLATGKTNVTRENLVKIADAFPDVDMRWLADDRVEKRPAPPAEPTKDEIDLARQVELLGGPGTILEIIVAYTRDQLRKKVTGRPESESGGPPKGIGSDLSDPSPPSTPLARRAK